MAGELLRKVEELQKLINKKSNKEFKKAATEYLEKGALDEGIPCETPYVGTEVDAEECCETPCEGECEHSLAYMDKVRALITEAIAEEEKAVAFYLKKAAKCEEHGDYDLAGLFREMACDEMVHSASLRTTLEIYGFDTHYTDLEGKREAFKILARKVFESADDDSKTASELQKEADKIRKEFDFAEEYSKNKAEYNREKVAEVINDLIAGKKDLGTAMEIIAKDGVKIKKDKKTSKK